MSYISILGQVPQEADSEKECVGNLLGSGLILGSEMDQSLSTLLVGM